MSAKDIKEVSIDQSLVTVNLILKAGYRIKETFLFSKFHEIIYTYNLRK